jgi:hypothetical protein
MITKLFRRVRKKGYGVLAGILLLGAIAAAAVRGSSTVANAAPPNSSAAIADDLSIPKTPSGLA